MRHIETEFATRCGARTLIVVAALVACGCTEQPYEPPPAGDLSGTWFGVRRSGKAVILWQTWKTAAGGIEISFVTCRHGEQLQSEHQSGTWNYDDGVYRTVIDKWSIDGEAHYPEEKSGAGDHEYRVLELEDARIVYRHRTSRQTFEMRRVEADFELGCDKIPRHTPRLEVAEPGALDARVVRRREPPAAAATESDPDADQEDTP